MDTDATFKIGDVVDAVERELPTGCPGPTRGEMTRRDVIAQMARDILDGEIRTQS
ncbi:hypothetical protein [Streptomyces sp. MMBL 11-3]|uniref:hypothetical protein n=1 Tax=Streptomyces sp. MMBL 11-3 TaxID=3382639 RepID=UPI0039B3F79F